MRYLKVEWVHESPDYPIELYSELDEEGWEVRKLEVFRDGSIGYASSAEQNNSTRLGELPVPPFEEIAADPQFRPSWIRQDEFEARWSRRRTPIGAK